MVEDKFDHKDLWIECWKQYLWYVKSGHEIRGLDSEEIFVVLIIATKKFWHMDF
jgi:hypothetical protein